MNRLSVVAMIVALCAPAAGFAQTAPAPAAAPAAVPPAPVAKAEPSEAEKAARAKFRAACSADVAKFCADAAPVAGATPEQMKGQRSKMRTCMETNKASLSADCKAAIVDRDVAVAARKS
jgi:hypothetical protein